MLVLREPKSEIFSKVRTKFDDGVVYLHLRRQWEKRETGKPFMDY